MTNEPEKAQATGGTTRSSVLSVLFDIRMIIAALLGVYGVLLLVAGVAPGLAELGARDVAHAPDRADMAVGSAGNLWVGAALALAAAGFAAWALIGSRRAGS